MSQALVDLAEAGRYQELFIRHLRWSAPDLRPIQVDVDGTTLTATNVSSYKGLRVWVCDGLPGARAETAVDRAVGATSTDRLVIFHSASEQIWRWPSKNDHGSSSVRLTRHRHRTRAAHHDGLAERLAAIQLSTDEPPSASTVLGHLRRAFDVEANRETRYASQLMARMYAAMERTYPPGYDETQREHGISVTLARVLFLLFADDTNMWRRADLFEDYVHAHTDPDGTDVSVRLRELFDVLNMPESDRLDVAEPLREFRYVNGGIFSEPLDLPPLDDEFRALLLEASRRDWSTISPAIFGSMFQSVRDAKTRRELGEHYTSEENILKTLNPLFLDGLRADLEATKSKKNEALALRRLRDRLGEIRFMDPACGCGNFIIVAYRELRDLELRIMERLQELTGEGAVLFANVGLKVHLGNFYGIEIDEWPARIAETAMFLIDRQCDLKLIERLGEAPDRLPVREQLTILVGNALDAEWADVLAPTDNVILAGNPPFVGHVWQTPEQQRAKDRVFASAGCGDLRAGRLDFVAAWVVRALQYMQQAPVRAAFVATNSVAQGEQAVMLRALLERFDAGILFAHRTFKWTTEAAGGAAVHVAILGLAVRRDLPAKRRLFDYATPTAAPTETSVEHINSVLADAPELTVVRRTRPFSDQVPVCRVGSKQSDGGYLTVTGSQVDEVRSDPIASRYLRPFWGSKELLEGKRRWCLWMLEAPADADLAQSDILAKRIAGVDETRVNALLQSRAKQAARAEVELVPLSDEELQARVKPGWAFEHIAQPATRYLATPEVSSANRDYVPSSFLGSEVIASNKLLVWPNAPSWVFGVVQSAAFQTWVVTYAGRLKSDPQIAPGTTCHTFPFVTPNSEHRVPIEQAADLVLTARSNHPGESLASLYAPSAMPDDLRQAHQALDVSVDALYGLQQPTHSERLRALAERYEMLVSGS